MNQNSVICVKDNDGNDMALIIKKDFDEEGVSFFTPGDYSQQVAFMHHPKGYEISPHVHNLNKREIFYTNEVLYIRKGTLQCDIYDCNKIFLCSYDLEAGDLILLISGGHGFTYKDEVEMYEIKQGPYSGDRDKTRFIPEKRS